mmetsp:Transcript_42766/g.48256  ORF Transcript_42766/g.48256 Transcript_42766/m.48256 type:complete len:190 (-) Transcript_42766:84-653(-)
MTDPAVPIDQSGMEWNGMELWCSSVPPQRENNAVEQQGFLLTTTTSGKFDTTERNIHFLARPQFQRELIVDTGYPALLCSVRYILSIYCTLTVLHNIAPSKRSCICCIYDQQLNTDVCVCVLCVFFPKKFSFEHVSQSYSVRFGPSTHTTVQYRMKNMCVCVCMCGRKCVRSENIVFLFLFAFTSLSRM